MKQAILQIKSGKQLLQLDESTEFLGLWVGKKTEQVDMDLAIEITKPNLSCQVKLKLILFDQAQVSIRSNFQISARAKQTDNYLKVAALTCSPDCKVEVTPGLEIKTNNLKAGHSLAISYLNPEELFYLEAKGLSKSEAESVLIAAFANELIDQATAVNKSTLLKEYAKLASENFTD